LTSNAFSATERFAHRYWLTATTCPTPSPWSESTEHAQRSRARSDGGRTPAPMSPCSTSEHPEIHPGGVARVRYLLMRSDHRTSSSILIKGHPLCIHFCKRFCLRYCLSSRRARLGSNHPIPSPPQRNPFAMGWMGLVCRRKSSCLLVAAACQARRSIIRALK